MTFLSLAVFHLETSLITRYNLFLYVKLILARTMSVNQHFINSVAVFVSHSHSNLLYPGGDDTSSLQLVLGYARQPSVCNFHCGGFVLEQQPSSIEFIVVWISIYLFLDCCELLELFNIWLTDAIDSLLKFATRSVSGQLRTFSSSEAMAIDSNGNTIHFSSPWVCPILCFKNPLINLPRSSIVQFAPQLPPTNFSGITSHSSSHIGEINILMERYKQVSANLSE